MPSVTDEQYSQRVDDWARLAKLKSDKWIFKRFISLCGYNQMSELVAQVDETLSLKRIKLESKLRMDSKMKELHDFFTTDLDEAC